MNTIDAAPLVQRIARISTVNAWSVTILAGSFTVLSLLGMSIAGVIVGAAVTAAGPIELFGLKQLHTDPSRARRWMMASQLWLILCVLTYCTWRLLSLDPDNPFEVFGDASQVFELVEMFGIPKAYLASLFIQAFYITYGLVAGLTLLVQGGLTVYYGTRIDRLMRDGTAPVSPSA